MYIKSHSYSLSKFGEPHAFVVIKINPLTFKLKAEIELKNGRKFEILSNGETNEQFENSIEREIALRS